MENVLLAAFLVVSTASLAHGQDSEALPLLSWPVTGSPLAEVEVDERPPMKLEGDKPFRLEFGRGSGLMGLETITIERDRVVLCRRNFKQIDEVTWRHWEVSTNGVGPNFTRKVAELIDNFKILDLHREYHANVFDGTQWVIWISQGKTEKAVYFNNHFPDRVQKFAVALDQELRAVLPKEIQWIPVPKEQSREHEKAIWRSLRPPTEPTVESTESSSE